MDAKRTNQINGIRTDLGPICGNEAGEPFAECRKKLTGVELNVFEPRAGRVGCV